MTQTRGNNETTEELTCFLFINLQLLAWPNFATFPSIMLSSLTHILINRHLRSPFQYPPPLRPGILSGSDGGKLVTSLLGVIQHEPSLCNASLLAWTVDIVPGTYRRRKHFAWCCETLEAKARLWEPIGSQTLGGRPILITGTPS